MSGESGLSITKPTPVLKKSIKVDFKNFSKALGKGVVDLSFGKFDGLAGDVVEALVPVQRPGRADAAECKHDHSTEHAEMRTVVLPVLRDRATAMASPRRGDRQPTPAPGMAKHRGPIDVTWW